MQVLQSLPDTINPILLVSCTVQITEAVEWQEKTLNASTRPFSCSGAVLGIFPLAFWDSPAIYTDAERRSVYFFHFD